MDLPTLHITPISLEDASLHRSTGGLKKSPSSWKLASLSAADDDDALSATDSEEETPEATQRRRSRSLSMAKPPRHKSMPICVQSVLNVWKCVLQRDDVSVLSDLFHDLGGTDTEAWELVEQMHYVGVSITLQQLYALRRCCVYSVLLTVL